MPHLSRKRLKREIFLNINDQFISAVLQLKKQEHAKEFLFSLLTRTERIMLAKRLMVVFMLTEGYSFSTIEETLKVSPATVTRFWQDSKQGRFAGVIGMLYGPRAQRQKLFQLLEEVLTLGLPTYSAPKRTYERKQYLREQRKKARKKKIKMSDPLFSNKK